MPTADVMVVLQLPASASLTPVPGRLVRIINLRVARGKMQCKVVYRDVTERELDVWYPKDWYIAVMPASDNQEPRIGVRLNGCGPGRKLHAQDDLSSPERVELSDRVLAFTLAAEVDRLAPKPVKVHRLRLTYLDQGTWMPLWMRLWLPVGYVQNYTLYFQPCSASLYDEVQDTTNKATQKDMQYTLENLHKWKADGSSEPVTVADVLELYRRAKGLIPGGAVHASITADK